MIAHPRPFIEVLSEIPECRANRGKRHPLGRDAGACVSRHVVWLSELYGDRRVGTQLWNAPHTGMRLYATASVCRDMP